MSRNIQTREGYDFWDRLCAIPTYGFLLNPQGNGVVRAEGVGDWIERHAAQVVVDDAQSEINVLREENARLKAFGPVLVERDKDGWWWHPGVPDFGGGEDPAPYYEWLKEQGLEHTQWSMERDLEDHPYWDIHSTSCGCNGWDPQSPGPEWFLMGIFDTEDGPYVQWARRIRT